MNINENTNMSDVLKVTPMEADNSRIIPMEESQDYLKLPIKNGTFVLPIGNIPTIVPTSPDNSNANYDTETIYNQADDLNKVNKSVFLATPAGPLNTIVLSHPYLWKLYKRLRSLDWDANEFDHSRSKSEMMSAIESDVFKISMTLIWQWEADSTASRVITDIICAFWPGTELAAIAQRITENESLHSHSYSEIVKNCFDNIQDVIDKLRNDMEPLKRLTAVVGVFKECQTTANRFRMGELSNNSAEVKRAKLLFFGAMIALERIQFTGSFNVTFTYGDRGSWNSIAKTVQKIAVDELSVHVRTWKYCFRNEIKLPEYQEVLPGVLKSINALASEVLSSELGYCDLLFKDGVNIERPGKTPITCDILKESIRYEAQNVYDFFGFELPFARIEKHPMEFTLQWKDINSVQTSPQEELTGNYLLGGFINDLEDGVPYIPSFLR